MPPSHFPKLLRNTGCGCARHCLSCFRGDQPSPGSVHSRFIRIDLHSQLDPSATSVWRAGTHEVIALIRTASRKCQPAVNDGYIRIWTGSHISKELARSGSMCAQSAYHRTRHSRQNNGSVSSWFANWREFVRTFAAVIRPLMPCGGSWIRKSWCIS
jgi:hypothetical protein